MLGKYQASSVVYALFRCPGPVGIAAVLTGLGFSTCAVRTGMPCCVNLLCAPAWHAPCFMEATEMTHASSCVLECLLGGLLVSCVLAVANCGLLSSSSSSIRVLNQLYLRSAVGALAASRTVRLALVVDSGP
jgi:hypothetical protein